MAFVWPTTVFPFVCEYCDSISDEYSAEVMHFPRTSAEWKAVAAEFSSRWNFHHTLGATDGKRVVIRCPRNGGSLYYNYKSFHSIIQFAIVDANYMWVDMSIHRSCYDVQIFNQSQLSSMVPYRSLQLNHFLVMNVQ